MSEEISNLIQALKSSDEAKKNMVVAKMKSQLNDGEFARELLEYNANLGSGENIMGLLLSHAAKLTSKNQISFTLQILERLVKYDLYLENQIDHDFVQAIADYAITTSVLNICKSSISILNYLALNCTFGFEFISFALKIILNKQPDASDTAFSEFNLLIKLLESESLDIKVLTLSCINGCILTIDDENMTGSCQNLNGRYAFISYLGSKMGIIEIFKNQKYLSLQRDSSMREQLYIFQCWILWYYGQQTIPFETANPDHEAMLSNLWNAVYPNEKLLDRPTNQWKLLGFQGQDPTTDFRGMGLLGLKLLLYMATRETKHFRQLILSQSSGSENNYPLATAGINLTQLLYDIFSISNTINLLLKTVEKVKLHENATSAYKSLGDGKIINIIFDNFLSLEQVFCISLSLLDNVWKDMNATYMMFPKVISQVRRNVENVLNQNPSTLSTFRQCILISSSSNSTTTSSASPTTNNSNDSDLNISKNVVVKELTEEEKDPLYKIRLKSKTMAYELVKKHSLATLRQGSVFALASAYPWKKAQFKQQPQQQQQQVRRSSDVTDSIPSLDSPSMSIELIGIRLQESQLCWGRAGDPQVIPNELPNTISSGDVAGVIVGASCPVFRNLKKVDDDVTSRTVAILLSSGTSVDFQCESVDFAARWADSIRMWCGKRPEQPQTLDDIKAMVDTSTDVQVIDLDGASLLPSPPTIPPPPNNFKFIHPTLPINIDQ